MLDSQQDVGELAIPCQLEVVSVVLTEVGSHRVVYLVQIIIGLVVHQQHLREVAVQHPQIFGRQASFHLDTILLRQRSLDDFLERV